MESIYDLAFDRHNTYDVYNKYLLTDEKIIILSNEVMNPHV